MPSPFDKKTSVSKNPSQYQSSTKQRIFKNAIVRTEPTPRGNSTYDLGKSISFEKGHLLTDSSIGGGLDRKERPLIKDASLMNKKLGSVLGGSEAPNFFQKKGNGMFEKGEYDRKKDEFGLPGLNTSVANCR